MLKKDKVQDTPAQVTASEIKEPVMTKEVSCLLACDTFIQTIDVDWIKRKLVKIIAFGISEEIEDPNDLVKLHHLHVFVGDVDNIIKREY